MVNDPSSDKIMNLIFEALHNYYDATVDYSSSLVIQFNMCPNIIDIHDYEHNRHYSITLFGENTHY
jgi:hypothetical protein